MKMNKSFAERVKIGSRNVFIGIGNTAVGNALNDNSKRGNMDIVPFSLTFAWLYEKPMPKRRSK